MKHRDATTPVTKSQLKYIFLCAKKLGLDNQLLHDVVYATTSKKSISKLTSGEAGNVIDVLARQAFPNAPKKRASNIVYLISAEQRDKILELLLPMGWNEQKADALSTKMYKKPMRHLTMRQAQGLIEALKSILSRNQSGTTTEECNAGV